jgi:hypothetical protein
VSGAVLSETGLEVRYLELELAEGVLMEDAECRIPLAWEVAFENVYLIHERRLSSKNNETPSVVHLRCMAEGRGSYLPIVPGLLIRLGSKTHLCLEVTDPGSKAPRV